MAMSATYTNFCGRVVHENRAGTERDYVRDDLGSTIALLDSGQAVKDSWTFWPYGEVATHNGTSTTPLTFCGTLGYYTDAAGRLYVRFRELLGSLARWLTRDPLWPHEHSYTYSSNSPLSILDPLGLFSLTDIWKIVQACGYALAGAILSILGPLLSGGSPQMPNLCNAGTSCLAAVIGTILTIALSPIIDPVLAACVGGAVSGALSAIGKGLCAGASAACTLLAALLNATAGCVGGMIGGIGTVTSTIYKTLQGLLFSWMGAQTFKDCQSCASGGGGNPPISTLPPQWGPPTGPGFGYA